MSLDDEKPIQQPRGPPEYLRSRKHERLKEEEESAPDNVINIFSLKEGGSGEKE
ncbi:hypothetical protein B6O39_001963 [Salmonella enterica subsp. enterica serovar Javiana]|nr:hypothetical protein [Salmonella enterica subsp. enterica serovar Javiana]MDJ6852855.1 hypothetical protein [Salmonella enterica]